MAKGPNGPIRRAQLIAPFGVGSMVMVPGGTSLIIAGLDYWYHDGQVSNSEIDLSEYKFQEWRLQQLLRVGHFRLPPDYRKPWHAGQNIPNAKLTIPALRFPAWHFCPSCHLLQEESPYARGRAGRIQCKECAGKDKTRFMFQVPFVAMCSQGHLQDFPWREWVHRSINPSCKKSLRLESTGSATLSGQIVKCDCGVPPRTLSGITNSDSDGSTFLSKTLDESGVVYTCRGQKPWLGPDISENCSAHLRGSLRNASNVYFARLRSAIYLPPAEDPVVQEVVSLLESDPLATLVSLMKDLAAPPEKVVRAAVSQHPVLLRGYTETQLLSAVELALHQIDTAQTVEAEEGQRTTSNADFRRAEYTALSFPRNEPDLKIREEALSKYGSEVTDYFSQLMLIDKLKETRAMAGFTRLYAENNQPTHELKELLFRNLPTNEASRWLPAYIVFGEGIFLQFNEVRLKQWEKQSNVVSRIEALASQYQSLLEERRLREREISPRFVLLHTFAHLLMNQLTFDCGYSSASLRERLYVATNPDNAMAGILIYTANGDSEGTMGGLVRMGKPGNIEPIIYKALESARWCSADPVCMEMGRYGQGPDSCNLAACHNCALVPETACEEFNRFLDRALVVGSHDDVSLGFFHTE